MLGPVILREDWMPHYDPKQHYAIDPPNYRDKLDWVICGGESGPGARPMHPDWARGLRDHCQAAQVPFFFKQWGEWMPYEETADMPFWEGQDGRLYDANVLMPDWGADNVETRWDEGLWAIPKLSHAIFQRVGKKAAGRMLDGRTWEERPGE
jgi:protein gp37